MDTIKQNYNQWAVQYDAQDNKTRDAEAKALREVLADVSFRRCLELGCGTGKNTSWLLQRAQHITAVDFSEEMLKKAKEKISSPNVDFIQADISQAWGFVEEGECDLVSFSLVLEHLPALEPLFRKAAEALQPGGWLFVGELHPFKQYSGSKARFDTEEGTQVLTCFIHHLSDFTEAARSAGLELVTLREYFDEGDRSGLPRILALLFRKA